MQMQEADQVKRREQDSYKKAENRQMLLKLEETVASLKKNLVEQTMEKKRGKGRSKDGMKDGDCFEGEDKVNVQYIQKIVMENQMNQESVRWLTGQVEELQSVVNKQKLDKQELVNHITDTLKAQQQEIKSLQDQLSKR